LCGVPQGGVLALALRPAEGMASEVPPPSAQAIARESRELARAGVKQLEVLRRGAGHPLLLLHGLAPVDPRAPFLDLLSRHAEITAPSHPGFGTCARPDDFDSVYDLVHLYLELMETLPSPVSLMGFSFGGWLAAEIAVSCSHRLDRLILVDALGIKVSGREEPDIADIFNLSPEEVWRRSWHDRERWAPDYEAMSEEELIAHARNRDALCLYGWHPYMHNPRLARWLSRITVPTLVLWGASDRIVTPAYGEAYARLVPGARFETIPGAGHHPEIEQPEGFARRVISFLRR